MTEFCVLTTGGKMLIKASSQLEAAEIAKKDGHILANAELWLQALESGEFKQTKSCLQDCIGHCCLGVAADVAAQHGIAVGRSRNGYIWGANLNAQPTVMAWLKLRDPDGRSENGFAYGPECLVNMNDRGVPFPEIARRIRHKPEAYLVV